jgi:DNA-binding NarL/FixJ family response regulator
MANGKDKYSPREKQIARGLWDAKSVKMIAGNLGISENTARTEKQHLFTKAQVHSVSELLKEMREHPEDF